MNLLSQDFLDQAETIRVALLRVELDLAIAFLRLAITESSAGSSERAVEYVERAILAHKNVSRHLEMVPPGEDKDKTELQTSARMLLDAIVSAERQFQILGISRRSARQASLPRVLAKRGASQRTAKAKLRLC